MDEIGPMPVSVPGGYTSGGTINATGTFTGKTIAGMGFIPGTYTWAWGGVAPDSVAITVVPEPGAASLAVAFVATVGVLVAKIRPCLIFSVPAAGPNDRVLATVVAHTTCAHSTATPPPLA